MAEFTAVDLTGQAPAQICPECAPGSLHHEPTQTDIAYCQHSVTGVYRVLGRVWKIVPGVEAHVFREMVARGVVAGELRVDVARSLRALQAPDTKH